MLSAYIQEPASLGPARRVAGRYRIGESWRHRVNPVSEWISVPFCGGWIIAFFNAIESTTLVSYKSLRFIGAVARDRIAGIGPTKYLVIWISLRTDEKKTKKKV